MSNAPEIRKSKKQINVLGRELWRTTFSINNPTVPKVNKCEFMFDQKLATGAKRKTPSFENVRHSSSDQIQYT